MTKPDSRFVIESFTVPAVVGEYTRAVEEIGLWESEKIFFARLPREGRVLDLGCGAGRTTFALHRLGFSRIEGLDLTPALVEWAQAHARRSGLPIPFRVGDACALPYADGSFDGGLFSFNGLMAIPGRANRIRALSEMRRVLVPGGPFVFTTHDRDAAPEHAGKWREEAARWREGRQDPRLYEFGDMIVQEGARSYFLHIPDRREVLEDLAAAGLERVAEAWRPELAREPEAVTCISVDCRFWAARRVVESR